MKFGFRTPSLTKRLAARTSVKRIIAHKVGLKAPRGLGVLTNPKKAAYNAIYSRTTIDPLKGSTKRLAKSAADVSPSEDFFNLLGLLIGAIWFICTLPFKLINRSKVQEDMAEVAPQEPVRWGKKEWMEFSVGLGFIVVVMAVLLDMIA